MMSARFTALAAMSSTTSPAPATGSGTSDHSRTSGPPGLLITTARMTAHPKQPTRGTEQGSAASTGGAQAPADTPGRLSRRGLVRPKDSLSTCPSFYPPGGGCSMLRDVGVRTKLLAVLAIPTALLIIVTSLLVAGQVASARRAGHVSAITSVAIQVNRVVHSLQQERSATLEYLQDPSAGDKAAMKGQRQYTNQQLASLRDLIATSPV